MRAGDLNNLSRMYGNFRSPSSRAKATRRDDPNRDSAHLAMIRKLPCTVCERHAPRFAMHAHHLRQVQGERRGVGQKLSDYCTVSLCFLHHHELHRYGSRKENDWFWDGFGISAEALAMGYKNQRGNFDGMVRVLLAHKLAASRVLVERRKP